MTTLLKQRHRAAVRIQASWRGYLARRFLRYVQQRYGLQALVEEGGWVIPHPLPLRPPASPHDLSQSPASHSPSRQAPDPPEVHRTSPQAARRPSGRALSPQAVDTRPAGSPGGRSREAPVTSPPPAAASPGEDQQGFVARRMHQLTHARNNSARSIQGAWRQWAARKQLHMYRAEEAAAKQRALMEHMQKLAVVQEQQIAKMQDIEEALKVRQQVHCCVRTTHPRTHMYNLEVP